jgi:hypothetical protein
MSNLFSQILAGAKTAWADITAEIATVFGPEVKAGVAALESGVKQAASNALAFADTEAGPILSTAAVAVEGAVDGLLAAIPGGALADPFANAGIKQGFDILHGIIDHGYAQLAAKLPPPVTMPPIPNPPE